MRRHLTGALVVVAVVAAGISAFFWQRNQEAKAASAAERETVAALRRERDTLQARLSDLLAKDRRLVGMPETPIRIGVPTSLARDLIERVVAGLLDQVTLELGDMRVRRSGTLRKVVDLGDWTLGVTVNRVSATLRTRRPDIRFGGNVVRVVLPVELAKGSGTATVHFRWDGRSLAGAVCGDLAITREVAGAVAPVSVQARGALHLTASADRIVATPRFPPTTVRLIVRPDEGSWQGLDELIEAQRGVCGFVLDRVNIREAVEGVITRGFDVRLPTEKLSPMAVPVVISPSVTVRGQPMAVDIRLSHLTITQEMIWLGPEIDIQALSSGHVQPQRVGLARKGRPPSHASLMALTRGGARSPRNGEGAEPGPVAQEDSRQAEGAQVDWTGRPISMSGF